MTGFDAAILLQWTGGNWHHNRLPKSISGFCFDARKIRPGECFIALNKGARDGHDFVVQAQQGGASSVLVERPLSVDIPQLLVSDTLLAMEAIARAVRLQFGGCVLGVTGSCGKTSTREMLLHLLSPEATHATEGNWNNRIGVPMTLFGLHQSRKANAVIEAGIDQPGEMSHLGRMIVPDLTVVTQIGPAHMEKLGSLDGIAAEKVLLFEHARDGSELIIHADLFRFKAFKPFLPRATVLVPANETLDKAIHGMAKSVLRYQIDGRKIKIFGLFRETVFTLASQSLGMRKNAVLALTAASRMGVPSELLKERLEGWSPAPNRGRLFEQNKSLYYLDCYNSNPLSLADALDAFVESVPEEMARYYVLGAMNELGPEAVQLHSKSVQALHVRPQDKVFLVGPEVLRKAYRDGMDAAPEQVYEGESVEKIKSVVAPFQGAFFLKGSRAYALERLLNPTI